MCEIIQIDILVSENEKYTNISENKFVSIHFLFKIASIKLTLLRLIHFHYECLII